MEILSTQKILQKSLHNSGGSQQADGRPSLYYGQKIWRDSLRSLVYVSVL